MRLTKIRSTLLFLFIGSFITLSAFTSPQKAPSTNPVPQDGYPLPYFEDFENDIYNFYSALNESEILTGISPYFPQYDVAPFIIPLHYPGNTATVDGRRCAQLTSTVQDLSFAVNTNGKESQLSLDIAALCKDVFGFNFNYEDSIEIYIECEDSQTQPHSQDTSYGLTIHGSKEGALPNLWNFSTERTLTKSFLTNKSEIYCVERNNEPSKVVINHLPQGTLVIWINVRNFSKPNNVWAIDNIKVEEMTQSEYNAVFYNSGQVYDAHRTTQAVEPIAPKSIGGYHFLGWTRDANFPTQSGYFGVDTMPDMVTFPDKLYGHTAYYAVWAKESEMNVCNDLLITETANNCSLQTDGNAHALQLFNGTGQTQDLTKYALRIEWYSHRNLYGYTSWSTDYYFADKACNNYLSPQPTLHSIDIPLDQLWPYATKTFPNNSTFIISNKLFNYASYLQQLAAKTSACEYAEIDPAIYPDFKNAEDKRFVIVKKTSPSASQYTTRVDACGSPVHNLICYNQYYEMQGEDTHVGMLSMHRKSHIKYAKPYFIFDYLQNNRPGGSDGSWTEWTYRVNNSGTMHLDGFGKHTYYAYDRFYYTLACDLEIFSDRVIKNGVTVVENGTKINNSDAFTFVNHEYVTVENMQEQYNTIIIHQGASLKVHVGDNSGGVYMTANRLILKSDSEEQPAFNSRAYSYITNGIAYHKVIANNTTHQLIALPFNCYYNDIVEVRHNSDYMTGWGMRYYDGESRSKRKPNEAYRNYWTWYPKRTDLLAFKGIDLVSAFATKEIEVVFQEHNLKGSFQKRGNADMKVPVKKYMETSVPNDKGWNLIGTPAFMKIKSLSSANEYAITGYYEGEDHIYKTETKVYVTVPTDNYTDYLQKEISSIDYLKPYTAFFVQARGDGSLNYERNLSTRMPRKNAPAVVSNHESKVRLELKDAQGQKDETTVYVDKAYSENYEVGDDLAKMKGKAMRPYLYTQVGNQSLAFAAVADSSVNALPLVYQISQSGNFELHVLENTAYDAIYLTDHATGMIHDLSVSNYYFSETQIGENATRFTLAFVGQKNQPTEDTTSLKEEMVIVPNADGFAFALPEQATVSLMDALGRIIYTQQYTTGKHTIEVSQKGIYLLVIQTASYKQTYKLNR